MKKVLAVALLVVALLMLAPVPASADDGRCDYSATFVPGYDSLTYRGTMGERGQISCTHVMSLLRVEVALYRNGGFFLASAQQLTNATAVATTKSAPCQSLQPLALNCHATWRIDANWIMELPANHVWSGPGGGCWLETSRRMHCFGSATWVV